MRHLTAPGRWSYEIYLFHNVVFLIALKSSEIDSARIHFGTTCILLISLLAITIISGSISVFILSPLQRFFRKSRSRRVGAVVMPIDTATAMSGRELPVSQSADS